MPTQITAAQRYSTAIGTDEQTALTAFINAIAANVIATPTSGTMNPAQAARLLGALAVPTNTSSIVSCPIAAQSSPSWPGIQPIWTDWMAYPSFANWASFQPGYGDEAFWAGTTGEAATQPAAFLNLVLYVLTQGYQVGGSGALLATAITATNGGLMVTLPTSPPKAAVTSVLILAQAQQGDWTSFFSPGGSINTAMLPPFTLPGNAAAQLAAFIRYVRKFFDAPVGPQTVSGGTTEGPPQLPTPQNDWLVACMSAYGAITFGASPFVALNASTLASAAASVFPADPAAQAWAVQAISTLNDLAYCANVSVSPAPATDAASMQFSIMEALYARGFTSAQSIVERPIADFTQALLGTVAYPYVSALYTNAQTVAGAPAPPPTPPPGGVFAPINDGTLTDCIPPEWLSPLGPVEYLHEMLKVSDASTCQHPFASGTTTLDAQVASRRGPLGTLQVTRANLETELPVIDLVNECLEAMASTSPAGSAGVVYDTADGALGSHKICEEDCCEKNAGCHAPGPLFATVPEYSTPGVPTSANAGVEPLVYDILAADFSACCLPYSQPLDVSRTYLDLIRTSRFETMRRFRKCITEFVLDPSNPPAGFLAYQWRYPVRIDTAIEYLHVTPEEYTTLFQGAAWPSCGAPRRDDKETKANVPAGEGAPASSAFALPFAANDETREPTGVPLPEFLKWICLSYCDFYELWESNFVSFSNGADPSGKFPRCEPCCLEDLVLQFPTPPGTVAGLLLLQVFVRLWRILRERCGTKVTFSELSDICSVLPLATSAGMNHDFIRQLAAFRMFCDEFRPALRDPKAAVPAGVTGAARTQILALWVGPSSPAWAWAVGEFVERVAVYAKRRHKCAHRDAAYHKLLAANLDLLSRLAGFDPAVTTDTWHAAPTHTLRFAEVLAKIYASDFSIDDVLYFFAAADLPGGDSPFPFESEGEAADAPFGLPSDEPRDSLWHLRRELLDTRPDDVSSWDWRRVEHCLREDFGFAAADVLSFGQHFFPETLESAGYHVDPAARRYSTPLTSTATAPAMWDTSPGAAFHYDGASTPQVLWTELPVRDEDVIAQLAHVRALQLAEQRAVQSLCFQPRTELAKFAFLFSSFDEAQRHLVEGRDAQARWTYFQREFALAHARCNRIARHLAAHVASVSGHAHDDGVHAAWLVLRELLADENKATSSWEADSGARPPVTWPEPTGGAFAALLGAAGTGLVAEFTNEAGRVLWRDVYDAVSGFGRARDDKNCPVPSILPALDLTLPPADLKFALVRNGLAMKDASGAWLGGAEGFVVRWTGALLVDADGTYEFAAGAPAGDGEKPSLEGAVHEAWSVTLRRGQRSWTAAEHKAGDKGEKAESHSRLPLRRGVYEVTIELVRPAPAFTTPDDVHPLHTGLQLQYRGPDTGDRWIVVPRSHLYRVLKDGDLGTGLRFGEGSDDGPTPKVIPAGGGGASVSGAGAYLRARYTSSIRDVRRTYQRAFKALLFVERFRLSAKRLAGGQSELGYRLAQTAAFAGYAYYRSGGGTFVLHNADFDFNFVPIGDSYFPPPATMDARSAPSLQRTQAMFDWWERAFDYTRMRRDVLAEFHREAWLLFDEALERNPADPGHLLRHIGADARHWEIDLHYFVDPWNPVFVPTSADLVDERWVLRAWHADLWARSVARVTSKDIPSARPDLWASTNPSALVAGETVTGNANLTAFVLDGWIEDGVPRRYEDIQRVNDGLRERGRCALLSYLSGPQGLGKTPEQLSEQLLIDVEVGVDQRASRIDEAISSVQSFVRRARLGLEPSFSVTHEWARLWDARFESYGTWLSCKRRELYKENWIHWLELERAERVEAFRFLDAELRSATLTAAVPGSMDYWPGDGPAAHPGLTLLQSGTASTMRLLPQPAPASTVGPSRDEGLYLLGTPDASGVPSWLAPVPGPSSPSMPPGQGQGDPKAHAAQGTPAPTHAVASPPAPATAPVTTGANLPLWMEAAIRLGTQFIRIAASAFPQAASKFAPHPARPGEDDCKSCCPECGCDHPRHVDEYYFWLVDGRHFDGSTQNSYYDPTTQEAAPWETASQLPTLLQWAPQSTVRLAWCRVHNGQFQPPRRSVEGIEVTPGSSDFTFDGRVADSLYFSVSGALPPKSGVTVTAPPGFRFDIATDAASVVLNLVPPAAASANPFPGGLVAYPYFAYFAPGARLFPLSTYTPAVALANALRTHCRFEAALKWYELAFNPLTSDNTWIHCKPTAGNTPPTRPDSVTKQPSPQPGAGCCDATDVSCYVARNRSIELEYLETLVHWGDALLRHDTPEASEQARLVLDTARKILGPSPRRIHAHPAGPVQTVANFTPLFPPLNPQLLHVYEQVEDRLALVHSTESRRRLRNGRMPYFGGDRAREGHRTVDENCCPEDLCETWSPYRFSVLVQKGRDMAARTAALGAALLAAEERGDAAYLEATRARFEYELSSMARRTREDQWRDSDWQVQALQMTKQSDQASRQYYAGLIAAGLNGDESQYVTLTQVAMATRTASNVVEAIAETMDVVPDVFVGFPCEETQLPVGSKLAGMFKTIARITNTVADIMSTEASLDLTEGGWDRRVQEWTHQVTILDIEIEQVTLQILAAERRRAQSLHELNTTQRQIEQSIEVQNFLRDKTTNHARYLWLRRETAELYYRMYELTLGIARQAQRAFNFERGHTHHRFIPKESWNSLCDGLLAGERLQQALAAMDKTYMDLNRREYELTKHISLKLQFPAQLLRLRTTGRCDLELPEWLFDLDYPGHYMRRIRSVTLTLPCVTGPYTGVHCKLTLLSSATRIDPLLERPAARCCDACGLEDGYEACAHDRRVVRQYAARESIATSSGQNDAGLFELNFRDERYLPFEYHGAVSRWRIELPPENNYFDMESLTDVVLNLNYTAREGGEALRKAAREAAERRLPDAGRRGIDVQQELPAEWRRFKALPTKDEERRIHLPLTRDLFQFLPGHREIFVTGLEILFEAPDAEEAARHRVEFVPAVRRGGRDEPSGKPESIDCVAGAAWEGLYHGEVAVRVGPIGRGEGERIGELRFARSCAEIRRLFVILHYEAKCREHAVRVVTHDCCHPGTRRERHSNGHSDDKSSGR